MSVDVIEPLQRNKQLIGAAFPLTLGLGIGALSAIVAFRNPVLSIALAAVIASSALGTWRPRTSFFLFLALLPFVDFLKRLQLAFTTPSSLEWYLILALPDILLLSTAVGVVLKQVIAERRLAIKMGRTDWWLLAFLGSVLLSIVHSVFPIAVGMAVFKLGGLYILVYFLAPVLITEQKYLRLLLKITFVLAIIVALYGLSQAAFGMTSFEEKWLTGGYTGMSIETVIYHAFRPFSTLSGPQAYAYYLVIGLTFGRAYVSGFISRNKRSVWYAGIFVVAIALGLSLVRTALLFFGLAWLLPRWLPKIRLRYRPMRLLLITALSIIVLMLILLRFGKPIQHWALGSGIPFMQRAFTLGTLGDRLRGWQGAMTNPRFWTPLGYGLGTTSSTVMSKYSLTFDLFSHDEYTNILIEQGVVGLVLFLGFVVSWMRRVVLGLQMVQMPFWKKISWRFMGFSLSVLLVGLLGANLKVSPINVYFWLVVGLLARCPLFHSEQICAKE
jgi:hypothetical protein